MWKKATVLARRLRQFRYPRALRIEADNGDAWGEALGRALAEAVAAARAAEADDDESSPGAAPSPAMGKDFFVALCNNHFRLRRNAEQLEREGKSSRELRRIKSALDKVDSLLDDAGVESLDLTGQEYDDGRLDFSPLSEPEEVVGLDRMRITLCERPLILLKGKMIQKATGIVARPAVEMPETEVQ